MGAYQAAEALLEELETFGVRRGNLHDQFGGAPTDLVVSVSKPATELFVHAAAKSLAQYFKAANGVT